LGKVYLGKNLEEIREKYFLSGITNNKTYFEIKGLLEGIFKDLGINEDPTKYIEISNEGISFELDYSHILDNIGESKVFKPLPKYPPIVEDLSIIAGENIKTSDLILEIKKQSNLVVDVSFLDQFENSRTFHVIYRDENKNLTGAEVLWLALVLF